MKESVGGVGKLNLAFVERRIRASGNLQIVTFHPVLAIKHKLERQFAWEARFFKEEIPSPVAIPSEGLMCPTIDRIANRDDMVGCEMCGLKSDF